MGVNGKKPSGFSQLGQQWGEALRLATLLPLDLCAAQDSTNTHANTLPEWECPHDTPTSRLTSEVEGERGEVSRAATLKSSSDMDIKCNVVQDGGPGTVMGTVESVQQFPFYHHLLYRCFL
ncbi:hypothetical protein EYF80_059226 [Liparis tanakae]|uniref:Uncharacterized protein n=1 Tax=Liparis tanakae TaxID=230148 RepID=A0A4Z2EQR5_9TELE|nr:hypothetical protein EYF80_059226 [Liparis tanakae]